ncbi:MAG TPA: hypothetical protein VK577_11185 [Bradyrhizobium sp.]|jgi:hypothetical protein|nr:hypothetical protein [Bradyrhizobium sp.]
MALADARVSSDVRFAPQAAISLPLAILGCRRRKLSGKNPTNVRLWLRDVADKPGVYTSHKTEYLVSCCAPKSQFSSGYFGLSHMRRFGTLFSEVHHSA